MPMTHDPPQPAPPTATTAKLPKFLCFADLFGEPGLRPGLQADPRRAGPDLHPVHRPGGAGRRGRPDASARWARSCSWRSNTLTPILKKMEALGYRRAPARSGRRTPGAAAPDAGRPQAGRRRSRRGADGRHRAERGGGSPWCRRPWPGCATAC